MAVDLKVAQQRAEVRVGSVINDKWRLDRLLGVGGMAVVYAATHRNKKRVAVKMLHPELSSDEVLRERFLREGYVANSVGHRGAVIVDDDDRAEDGSAFLVMELLEGESIEQRWQRRQRRLPLEEVLAIADQVLDTLSIAHDRGIVHRDIKPENLFLTREGVVKLLDFGIARLRELSGWKTVTESGATMGTPAFMAPEQARGRWEQVDGRTDLWALGATMFTLLSGQHVHPGEGVNETLAMAVTRPARPLATIRPDLPTSALWLIDKSLSYAKSERFPNARAMQAALRAAFADLSAQDVARGRQLSIPEVEPGAITELETDRRRHRTTAPGGGLARTRDGASTRRTLTLGLGAAAIFGVSVWAVYSLSLAPEPRPEPAAASAEPLVPPPAASALAPSWAPAPAATLAPALDEAPPLSIDQLPTEDPKGAAKRGAKSRRGVAHPDVDWTSK